MNVLTTKNECLIKIVMIIILVQIGIPIQAIGQTNSEEKIYTVFLIGDAGGWNAKKDPSGEVLKKLQAELNSTTDDSRTILFLGDNVYPKGLPSENFLHSKQYNKADSVLKVQLGLLEGFNGHAYFIPGNHDWARGKVGGMKRITRQAKFVNENLTDGAKIKNIESGIFQPINALPGPYSVKISDDISLVIIDTQWFLQGRFPNGRGKIEGSRKTTEDQFWSEMDNLMDNTSGHIIIAAHHPLQSIGGHGQEGKRYSNFLKRGFFEILATVLTLRTLTPYMELTQDIPGPRYQELKKGLMTTFKRFKGKSITYVAGHEHNSQYWIGAENRRFIVSGAGSKGSEYNMDLKEEYEAGSHVDLIYPEKEDDIKLGYFKLIYRETGELEVYLCNVIDEKCKKL